jgi:hypothetical protein
MPDNYKWHILNFKPIGKGSLTASFSLETPYFIIHSCLYFKRDGNCWVGWPSRQYEDKKGNTTYSILVEPAPHLKKRMSDWILAKLKKLEVVEKNQPVQEVFDDPDDEIPY